MVDWFDDTTWVDNSAPAIDAAQLNRIDGAIAKITPASFSSSWNLNGRVAMHGDSQNLFNEGWAGYLCVLSNAAIRPVLVTSYAGYTSAQLLANIDAQILDVTPKVGMCIIQAGANNAAGGSTLTAYKNGMTGMVDACRAKQVTPIVTTVLPNSNATYDTEVRRYNAWLRYWCPDNEVMLVDTHAAVASSTGGWLSGMADADGLHPSPQGHKAMAEAFINSVPQVIPPRGSVLMLSAGEPNLVSDSVLMTTGWNSTGLTPTFLTDPYYGFKWCRITGVGTTLGKHSSPEVLITNGGYAVGDILRFAARVRSGQTIATAKAGLQVQIVAYDNSYVVKGQWLATSINGSLSQQIFDGVCAVEFTVPAQTTKIIVSLLNATFDQSAGVTGTYDMALPTLVNLTTLGITP